LYQEGYENWQYYKSCYECTLQQAEKYAPASKTWSNRYPSAGHLSSPSKFRAIAKTEYKDREAECGGLMSCQPAMRGEEKVVGKLSANEIRNLGFDWPKYLLVEEYCVMDGGKVDLAKTIEGLQASRAFYKRQLTEAYAFKTQHGADYSDFTDRFDEYARMDRDLGVVISYLERIIGAAEELA